MPGWLVTGAAGRLGQSLASELLRRALPFALATLPDFDLARPERIRALLERERPDIVVNAAAYTNVDGCESQVERAHAINAEGPAVLASWCRGRALLVHVSTDYVFDGRAVEPYAEAAPSNPLSVYGRSKLAGEQAVRAAAGEHLIVRTSWLFGPGPRPCFVSRVLERAAGGQALRVVADEWGRPTWTGSLAAALVDVAARGITGTLHLANRGETTRHGFAREIVRQGAERGRNPEVPVEPIRRADLDLPAERPERAVLSLERAKRLGVELVDWREALAAYLDALQAEEESTNG